jgi:hypothetical protein
LQRASSFTITVVITPGVDHPIHHLDGVFADV